MVRLSVFLFGHEDFAISYENHITKPTRNATTIIRTAPE